jgi:hypothetical protein
MSTEALTIQFGFGAVDFKDREFLLAINQGGY